MALNKQRKININEATGMRVVSQYVQEFWECGWQPFDQRNDTGIDGIIILKSRGKEIGVRINVQVKCGGGYISSIDNLNIRFKFKSKTNLEKHIKYWKNQIEPAVLIFVNPGDKIKDNIEIDTDKVNNKKNRLNPEAWWVDLKSINLKTENTDTLINIPLKQKFGEHSKGDFFRLCNNLIPKVKFPKILLEKEYRILISNIKKPRDFFKEWKEENGGLMFCLALKTNIIISNVAWKHITSKKRGQERIELSKKYLGVAKQIIEQVEGYTIFNQKNNKNSEFTESKIGIKANVETKEQDLGVIQVVLNVREDKNNVKKIWLYSVHQVK